MVESAGDLMLRLKRETENLDAFSEDEVESAFLQTPVDSVPLSHVAPTVDSRGTASNTYDVGGTDVRRNDCTNPSFETDLTDWTLDNSGDHTVDVNARDTGSSHFGGASLHLDISASASASARQSGRYFDIAAAPAEVWSIGAYVRVVAATASAQARLFIEWLNGASAVISSASSGTGNGTTQAWGQLSLANQTAPALTVTLRVYLQVETSATSQAVEVYWDGVQIEERSALTAYFDGYENFGFWQGAVDGSVSIKDADGDAIIAGFWTVG